MAIGEILLSAFFQVLFEKLASVGLDFAQRQGAIHFSGISIDLLNKWKTMLDTIYKVLDDAEDKQLSGKGLVKLWLDDVKDLAYDMEDLLNEIAIEAAQAKLEAESSTSRGLVKWNFSLLSQHKSSISNLKQHSLVSKSEVQKINDRFEEIFTKKAHLSLTEHAVNRSDCTNESDLNTSLPETRFLGREKEKAEILQLLIAEAKNDDTKLSIVPIVGMGGVGKTALAQQLYNDAKVSSCFDEKAWVCVSDVFDVLNITRTILRSIHESSNQGENLNELQVKLKNSLSRKKFLVVLDDVWNESYRKWTVLLKPFEGVAKGSKIIITTRNHDVVSITRASAYPLKELSLDNCTSLLAFHALEAINFERHPDLEKIGKKLGEKCKGSPLAATVLGGLLHSKRTPDQWEAIFNHNMWDLLNGENDEVLQVLKLSYVHLPSYLKRCFAYCAIFPKDYEIQRDELVLLWIVEGFLDGQEAKENILELGRTHFDKLLSRSFLQQSSVNASKFSMHDLLNDLAKSIASGTCFSSGASQLASYEDNVSLEKARYASFSSSRYVTSKCIRTFHQMKVLRSLMLLHDGSSRDNQLCVSTKVLHELLTKLKYLRVFSLHHCSMVEVPNCIGDLKHLRYLNFSYTNIKRLPESIGTLGKLQVLILRGCKMLSMLPRCITKLVNLQFLDIRFTWSLKEMPPGIGNLKNLTILTKFVVGLEKGTQLKELKNLPHLQGELFISELQKVEEVRDVVDANLFRKQGLSKLFLYWGKDFRNLRNDKHEAQVIHSLRPHTNLEKLTISCYGGATFPSWLDGPSKMVSLCLEGCPKVTLLPSLGQLPSLKELSLEGLHAISVISSEFYGDKRPFPSLSTLKFKEMLAWKDWSHYVGGREEEVPFSCLRHLIVRSCPSLVGTLPCQLDHLTKLEIHSCQHLNNSTGMVCLPSLRQLYLENCNKEILKSLVNLTSLSILKIQNLAEFVCFDHGFMSNLIKLKTLRIGKCDKLKYLWQDGNEMQNLTCLQSIVINRCPQFTSFMAGEGETELPYNLEMMELSDCMSLEKLPSKMHTLRKLSIVGCPKLMGVTIPLDDPISNDPTSHLKSLRISKCDSLTSFPFVKGRLAALKTLEIDNLKGVKSLEEIIVESLDSLSILYCENLGSLPHCLHMLSHLTCLKITDCTALEIEDFPPLPVTLSSLTLSNCPKIKSITSCNIVSCSKLTKLEIWDCPALEIADFPPLPVTLLSLTLSNCPKIKSITGCNIASCSNLTKLEIWDCPALEIADLPPLPITLSELSLRECPKIKFLSNRWNQFTSLRELTIIMCQNIKCFPKGGLPPNLRGLIIFGCENLEQSMGKWGLPQHTSLTDLLIDGSSMGGEREKVQFPSEDEDEEDAWSLLFPSSLISLRLENMRNVERLSSGLKNHLSSLQDIVIFDCPKLRCLPEDGLPPSLQRLYITKCENLKDRCSKHTGNYWPLIQEIPYIDIDNQIQ